MPQMVMNRNWTVRTLTGHTIAFEKGKKTHVPPDFKVIEECRRFGAEFVDEKDDIVPSDGPVVTPLPRTPAERRAKILQLFAEMKDNQSEHRNHFTAAGRPAVRYVNTALGFDIGAPEIEDLWNELLNSGSDPDD